VQKVLIVQAEMKHYRLPFFVGLYEALRSDGIQLTVAYSNSNPAHASRKDRADLPAPLGRHVPGKWFFGKFLYQGLWKEILQADLVIIGSELKYLLNPPLILLSWLRLKTVAFWGLGPNRHTDRFPLSEWIKQHFFTSVNWYFAYTPSVVDYLASKGMPADRITNVQNATDSAELVRLIGEIPESEVAAEKLALTGSSQSQIGFYCGLIGEIKAIPLLIETARLVKARRPDFHLVMIGSGPDRPWLEAAIANDPWIHYLGSKFGRESALYYKMADVFLMAGAAGLAVVDSFAAGLPLLLTDLPHQPPEVSYVVDGENGRFAAHNAAAFCESIVAVLSDPALMATLRAGARAAGRKYTIEAMVQNYREGIHRCLRTYCKSSGVEVGNLAVPRS